MDFRKLMIAAPSSNTGKTLISTAIAKLFKDEGLKVIGAKTGPDYIDAEYLTHVCGVKAHNFDLFLMGEAVIKEKIDKLSNEFDMLVVEGVMGYFDGVGNTYESSSFDLSKKFDIGTVLLYEPKGEMFSMVPKIKGMVDFSCGQIKGVIFNKTSKKVFDMIAPQIEEYVGIKPLGYIPRDERLEINEESLGLIRPNEIKDLDDKLELLCSLMRESVDIDLLLESVTIHDKRDIIIKENPFKDYNILMAKDEAFCFHYASDLYDAAKFFSPLHDKKIDENCDLLYIGGGYPELYRFKLAENKSMLNSIKEFQRKGGKIIAEGGGLMYLSKRIGSAEMVGIFPGETSMTKGLVNFGYQKALIIEDYLGSLRGEFNAREYHRGIYETTSRPMLELKKPIDEDGSTIHNDGYKERNAYGSYSQTHPDSMKDFILNFLRSKF